MNIRSKDRVLSLLRASAVVLLVGALAACATSHVLVGQERAPIAPEQVRVYLQPPARYQEIAFLETSSRPSFAVTAQQKTDVVIDRLRREAASLGANGIVLKRVADQSSGSVGGFGGLDRHDARGTGIVASATVLSKDGSAIAIYVPPDSLGTR